MTVKKSHKKHNELEQKPLKTINTKITIKYDVGFSNSLFIRGKGASLNWDKGTALKCVGANEWVWETNATFTFAEFKVLINDRQYEAGPNHSIKCGATILYTPKF